jgi:hypothetical protein
MVRTILTAGVFAFVSAMGQSPQPPSPQPVSDIVRQVDHILIESDQPEKLFHLFLDKFELPLAWPYKSYGTFSSGGVGFGNVNLETIHLEGGTPGIAGVAFEPVSIEEAVAGLDAKGLKHDPPAPAFQKDAAGNQHLARTTMELRMVPEGLFFCKYNTPIEPRRARIQSELQARNGGPLGIEKVEEIVIGVRDMAAAQGQYRALLGQPRSGDETTWSIGNGPAIHLVTDNKDRLVQVRIKVKSLEQARAYLKSQKMLGTDTGHEVALDPAQLGETDIRFVP